MKTAIIYASVHHGNTGKLLEAIEANMDVKLIDATKTKKADLSQYDTIGFASGIYFGKFHRLVADFAACNLPENKNVFLIYTYGSKSNYADRFMKVIADKNPKLIGFYGCQGFDTFGPFKIIGGIAKGHPDEKDIAGAVKFAESLRLKRKQNICSKNDCD